jgi:hypothetical protein
LMIFGGRPFRAVAETAVGVFSKKIAFTGFLSCGLP